MLWIVAAAVFILNVPFGYWRAGVRKFSLAWFLAIHLPIPLIILLRIYSGLGFRLITFPVIIAAYFAGQFAGTRLKR